MSPTQQITQPGNFPIPTPSFPWVSVICAAHYSIYPITKEWQSVTRAKLLISYQGYTGDTGKCEIRLQHLIGCTSTGGRPQIVITDPNVVFIATPNSESPVVLTWSIKAEIDRSFGTYDGCSDLVDEKPVTTTKKTRYNITITVKSWDLGSRPILAIPFGWLCIAEGSAWEDPA